MDIILPIENSGEPKKYNFQVILIICPIYSSALPPLPSSLHSAGCPSRSAPPSPVVWGAGRRFTGASWMHEYPAVQGCGVDVVLVSCRRLLKYKINDIFIYVLAHTPATAAREGGNVSADFVDVFEIQTADERK